MNGQDSGDRSLRAWRGTAACSLVMRCSPVVAALGLIACGAPARPAPPAAAEPSWVAEVRAQAAADPGDAGALYLLAYLARSDRRSALSHLGRLDRLGWDFPLDPREFPGLVDTPEGRALSTGFAAREPSVHTSTPAFTGRDASLIPEGIAFDPQSGAFFLGSIARRKIVRIDLVPGRVEERDLVATGLGGVLGIEVDPGRRLLWAAHNPLGRNARREGRAMLSAFDIDSGALVREAGLAGVHLFNDVAITAAGDVYVTASEGGGVYRLPAGSSALEPVVPPGALFYPNGLVWAEELQLLLVADAGGIHVVSPDRTRRRLGRGPARTLGAIDGLVLSGRALVAVQNGYGRARIVRFDLDAGLTGVERVEVLETGHESFASPTTGVMARGAFHYIANSHVSALDDEGAVARPSSLRPPLILATPIR
jgi:sugar lactone lactonase YvrE